MPRPDHASRSPRYRLYRRTGGLLPYDVWLKHQAAEKAQAPDAIVLPPSFWVVVVIAVACVFGVVGIIGRAAGWW